MTNIANIDFIPPESPWELFAAWYQEALSQEINDPNAMSVATLGENGMPSLRILLMKDYSSEGFTFYTNRQSRKGEQLLHHSQGALCFHWKTLKRQVRAEGSIKPLQDHYADTYFATRPRGSQIAAWASLQSQPLDSRKTLEGRVAEFEKKFASAPVPRPPHWGGYILEPLLLEFWQDREFRLHDRFQYRRSDIRAAWSLERLYP